MPLETLGSVAAAGSSGANARGARSVPSEVSNAAFAASSARGENSDRQLMELPSPAPNVAAYLSPFIRLDLQTRLAIVQYRDSETGEVQQQYPSPRVVREYQQNLPEESDLRTDTEESEAKPQAKIVGSAEDRATNAGRGSALFPATASFLGTTTAAVQGGQNTATSGRELAIA